MLLASEVLIISQTIKQSPTTPITLTKQTSSITLFHKSIILTTVNMMFSAVLALAASAVALPTLEELAARQSSAQTLNLVFHDATSNPYNLTMVADGSSYATNSNALISIIDDDDYAAYTYCHFIGTDGNPIALGSSTESNGKQHVNIDPPAEIVSVNCKGYCVGIYGKFQVLIC